ncbi:MAG: uracil-DNA glycosylase [Planctomycetota bacterium]|nr:uracil-DNA glycosylase [Planctomycetota bacterium]
MPSEPKNPDWRAVLTPVLQSADYLQLQAWLESERQKGVPVLPPANLVFAALDLVAPDDVRVVIVGQDPYPTPGHAHGLAFSYRGAGALPASLRNIRAEVRRDLGADVWGASGDLTPWARQGVLLLNTVLTVEAGHARSHRGRGWEALTGAVLDHLLANNRPLVFMLWGNDAKAAVSARPSRHTFLEAAHPSPFSVKGFRGCGHFSAAQTALGSDAIDWRLP